MFSQFAGLFELLFRYVDFSLFGFRLNQVVTENVEEQTLSTSVWGCRRKQTYSNVVLVRGYVVFIDELFNVHRNSSAIYQYI